MSAPRVRLVWAMGILIGVALPSAASAQSPSQATYTLTLSHAEESLDPSGRTVLTMMAAGDLQGALTVKLDRAADGTVTGGEWALTVSYTEIVTPPPAGGGGGGGTVEDPGEILVQKGVLKGDVTAGVVSQNGSGAIDALSGVQLLLTGGTLAYEAVASGAGSLTGSAISDRDASSGSITLIF